MSRDMAMLRSGDRNRDTGDRPPVPGAARTAVTERPVPRDTGGNGDRCLLGPLGAERDGEPQVDPPLGVATEGLAGQV